MFQCLQFDKKLPMLHSFPFSHMLIVCSRGGFNKRKIHYFTIISKCEIRKNHEAQKKSVSNFLYKIAKFIRCITVLNVMECGKFLYYVTFF